MPNFSRLARMGGSMRCNQLLTGALLCAAVTSFTALAQAPVYNVTPFQVPGNSGTPQVFSITTGKDGNLWFTDTAASYIGKITPSGTVTQYPIPASLGYTLGQIVSGPDGNLWFLATIPGDVVIGVVGSINTSGVLQSAYNIPSVSGGNAPFPEAITVGSDGALWFTDSNNALIWRVTTAGAFTNYETTYPTYGIGSNPSGLVWFTEYNVVPNGTNSPAFYGYICNVVPLNGTAAGGTVVEHAFATATESLPLIGYPVDSVIVTGANVYFTEYNGTAIGSIPTSSNATATTLYTATTPIEGMVLPPTDNALWFTQLSPTSPSATFGQLGRLGLSNPTQAPAIYSFTSTFSEPYAITSGPDNGLWFTDYATPNVGRAVIKLTVSTATLPNGSVGVAYPNTQLTAAGGLPPLTWSLVPSSGVCRSRK